MSVDLTRGSRGSFRRTRASYSRGLMIGGLIAGLVPLAESSGQQQKPDIVLIQTDDQPYHTLQYMPNVRSLIGDQGVTFAGYYVSTSLCAPSRASTLTGQHSHHHGIVRNDAAAATFALHGAGNTLSTWLRAGGYRTALIGKYLNNYQAEGQFPTVPPGWDYWRAFQEPMYWGFQLSENGVAVPYDSTPAKYSTYVLRNKALKFIASTRAHRPMFLYLAPYAPHAPMNPAVEDLHTFDGLARWDSPDYNEADVSDKPAWVRRLGLADDQVMRDQHENQIEALQAVDRLVEAVVDALAQSGRLANTYIIFTSDNGWALGAHRWIKKWCVYEECSREPLLIRGPGIPAGVTVSTDKLVSNVDLAATISDWAGVTPGVVVDGVSLRPLLDNPSIVWNRDLLLENRGDARLSRRYWSVRAHDGWEYTEYDNGDRELYDLTTDPFQLQNKAGQPAYAAKQAELDALLEAAASSAPARAPSSP